MTVKRPLDRHKEDAQNAPRMAANVSKFEHWNKNTSGEI